MDYYLIENVELIWFVSIVGWNERIKNDLLFRFLDFYLNLLYRNLTNHNNYFYFIVLTSTKTLVDGQICSFCSFGFSLFTDELCANIHFTIETFSPYYRQKPNLWRRFVASGTIQTTSLQNNNNILPILRSLNRYISFCRV
jgi:hypothetical protein